jgi:bacillolysin
VHVGGATMGNAKYVGRVGALAVALGIGSAVATAPWVAMAEPSDSASSASDTSSSTSSSASSESDTSTVGPDANGAGSGISQTSVGAQESSTETESAAESSVDPRSGILSSSGGLHTSSTPSDTVLTPVEQTPPSVADTGVVETPAIEEPATNSDTPDTASPQPGDDPVIVPAEPTRVSDPSPNAAATVAAPDPPAARSDTADSGAGLRVTALEVTSVSSTATASAVPSAAVPQLMLAPQASMTPVGLATGMLSGLLAWGGLGPSLTTSPVAPVAPPPLWGLLAWVTREIQRTFFNQTPTTNYNPVENSQTVGGVVTGDLDAADADCDPLTFTVTEAPQNGAVVINPDGSWRPPVAPTSSPSRLKTREPTCTACPGCSTSSASA